MNKSVWSDSIKLPEFERLNKDIKTDVLIIGGGICGLLCAYYLKQRGVDCVVVEAKKTASGTTKNTTAKITFQHGLIYDKLMRDFGHEKAQMYLAANQNAAQEYEKLCKSIDCDYKKTKAYTYSMIDRNKIENEVKALNSLGFKAQFISKPDLPFHTAGAICSDAQAELNPLKFVAGIANRIKIYEHTFIRNITPYTATADNGKITAKKIIVATHFPFINKHGSYFLKMYQHRSYVSAYESAAELDGMYVDEDIRGLSLRNYKNLLLIGGGGHRTGKRSRAWEDADIAAKKYYPRAKLKYQWSTQDCMSLDGVPYIGQYSKNTPDLYVASGFNKWGFTSAMAAAMILGDMIEGKENVCAPVFDPQRSILKPQLFVNGFETLTNFIVPTVKRCPHMGCALKWNKNEKSWDCPCHGSRFEENGKLIDNPATNDAKSV